MEVTSLSSSEENRADFKPTSIRVIVECQQSFFNSQKTLSSTVKRLHRKNYVNQWINFCYNFTNRKKEKEKKKNHCRKNPQFEAKLSFFFKNQYWNKEKKIRETGSATWKRTSMCVWRPTNRGWLSNWYKLIRQTIKKAEKINYVQPFLKSILTGLDFSPVNCII